MSHAYDATGGVMGVFMMSCWLTRDPVAGEAYLRSLDNDDAEGVNACQPRWESTAKEGIMGGSWIRVLEHLWG